MTTEIDTKSYDLGFYEALATSEYLLSQERATIEHVKGAIQATMKEMRDSGAVPDEQTKGEAMLDVADALMDFLGGPDKFAQTIKILQEIIVEKRGV